MRRFMADLGWALAGLLGFVIVSAAWLIRKVRPNDREALGLSLIAWLALVVGLVVTFPSVWH